MKSLLRKSSDKHVAKRHECAGHRQCGKQQDQCFVSARAACPPAHVQSEKREQAKGGCDDPPSGPGKEQAGHDHHSERKRQGQPARCCFDQRGDLQPPKPSTSAQLTTIEPQDSCDARDQTDPRKCKIVVLVDEG